MGPIYGTIFTEMSDAAEDAGEIDLELFIRMMAAGLEGLYGIVEARPGDKTLVDALYPALMALKAARDAGMAFPSALDKMKAAAKQGMESTKELVAKYGRSARLGERSRGVLDAGAASCNIILCAMADGMKAAMRE
jgi:dihydroxyacetone kinase-like protein